MPTLGNTMTRLQQVAENGTSAKRFIRKGLADAAARLVDSLRINSVSERVRHGRRVAIKRRNGYGEQLADLTNLYFRMAGIPIRFWAKAEDWQRWEVECFKMLNGDRFRAWASGDKTVCADKLPGKSLWEYLEQRRLTRKMVEAAGVEFRRAHQFRNDEFRGPWSHGDAGANNVIYDEKTGRARFIDFEIVHEKSLPAKSRHADDLLVFLLDLIAVAPNPHWLTLALSFLNAYGNTAVICELEDELALPSGMAWIWWGVRTSFANPAKVKRRLEKIRDVIANLEFYRAFAARRARKRRRASISCQVIRPGIPSPSSRTLAIKERAKAVAPSIPRRPPIRT
jgi:tRNA A-37 threonylcarbamoyl transferase component Bud32